MTFSRNSVAMPITPGRTYFPVETVHTEAVNRSDTLAAYKLEREQREAEKRLRAMRRAGFGGRFGSCG